jgi:4-amino-4-deoxy-L-arabinose transferase-like glycosyltransferase
VRRSWGLWLILVFAATARVLYFLTFRAFDPYYVVPIMDAARYHRWARAIAAGQPFEPGPFYQAPLYPYFMGALYAVFGPHPHVAYIAQMVMGLAVVFLVHRMAAYAYGARAGLIAAALAATYGVFAFNETKLLPATLTVLLGCVLVDRAQRAGERVRDWVLLGLAAGLAAIASPALLLLGASLAGWAALDRPTPWRARRTRLLSMAAAMAVVIAPVTIRNAVVGGDLVLIGANGGMTFYHGNNPDSLFARGGFIVPTGFTGVIDTQRDESRRIAEQEAGRSLRDSEVSSFWFRKGLAYDLDHPAATLELLLHKLLLAADSYEPPLEYNAQLDPNRMRHLMPVPFGLVLALASLRLLAGRITRREWPLLLLVAVPVVTLLVFFVSSRYRLPMVPALMALAGAGVASLIDRRRERRAWMAIALAVVVALVSLVGLRWLHQDLYRDQEAQGLADRASAYRALGRKREAERLYRMALARQPAFFHGQLELGKLLLEAGDAPHAEEAFRAAESLDAENPDPPYELGAIAYRAGRLDDAATHFLRAYRLAPQEPQSAHNALLACLRAGRATDAIALWRDASARGLPIDPPIQEWMDRNAGRTSGYEPFMPSAAPSAAPTPPPPQ